MEAAYYKEYYHLEREHWWFRAREHILAGMVSKFGSLPSDATILNVGAATGRSSEMLGRFGRVTSLEYDADCCAFTRELTGMDLVNGSVLDLPFESDTFDLVTAFDVIEHVEDDQRAAQELTRVCKPGGTVFITVPAYAFLWSKHDEVNHHFRRYHHREIVRLFDGLGHCRFNTYFNTFLFPPIAAYRLVAGLFGEKTDERSDAGSDFFVMNKGSLLQEGLYHLFSSEKPFLKKGIRFPFGVSYLFMLEVT